MANIVLSQKNRIDSTVSFYGDGDVANPLTNMRDSVFSNVWRYTPGTNADGNVAKFHFVLSSVARAGHAAFPRHNMGEAAQIRVRAGTARLDLDFTDDDLNDLWSAFSINPNFVKHEYRARKADNATLQMQFPAAPELTENTTIETGTDADTHATYLRDTYSVNRGLYMVGVRMSELDALLDTTGGLSLPGLLLNDVVKVTYPRFGFDSGKYLAVLGYTLDYKAGEAELTLWG